MIANLARLRNTNLSCAGVHRPLFFAEIMLRHSDSDRRHICPIAALGARLLFSGDPKGRRCLRQINQKIDFDLRVPTWSCCGDAAHSIEHVLSL